ncbi:hypothetical protein HYX04_00255 [Candidatus Woesearchaeota archaeon]|nr:hypothetical protein [Candidatus Woesearchaeota archaeon]
MNSEITESCKRKLAELEGKISKLNADKIILVNLLNETKAKHNLKLSDPLQDIDLQEEISYLNDWIKFHSQDIEKYKAKLKNAEQAGIEANERILDAQEKSVEESFKFIFKEKGLKPTIKERLVKFKAQKPLFAYAIPFIVLALIITSLFLFKPSVVGYVVLSKETAYNESLNLRVNESGAYEWNVRNPGSIKSLKASGSVVGNGTVKVYIEKDGKRYLIYQNK